MMQELPIGWCYRPLKDVVQPRGEKVSPSDYGDMPFLGMDHVEAHSSKILGSVEAAAMKSSAARFYAGDVLYGRLRPYLNKVALPSFEGLASAEFIVFPTSSWINNKFLKYRLSARDFVSFASHLNEGDRPRVNFDQIGNFEILFPPRAEQDRIVAKIEELFSELDKGVESLKIAKQQLVIYRQSLLKAAFEGKLTEEWRNENLDESHTAMYSLEAIRQARLDRYEEQIQAWKRQVEQWNLDGEEGKKPAKPKPVNLTSHDAEADYPGPQVPASWATEVLGLCNTDIFDGPFGSNLKTKDYVAHGVRVVRLENVGPGHFLDDKKSFISHQKYEELKKHTIGPGDLVFSSFVTERVRVAVVPASVDVAINKADCFCIRTFGEILDSDFLASYLSTRFVFKSIVGSVHGVGRPRINTTQLKKIPIPVPTIEEQWEIMRILDARMERVMNLDDGIESELLRLGALRQSILKKAFSGQLVSQDPNDEPATLLLERIKREREESEALAEKAKAAVKKKPKRKASS